MAFLLQWAFAFFNSITTGMFLKRSPNWTRALCNIVARRSCQIWKMNKLAFGGECLKYWLA